jgi:hypothetical protein
MILTIDTRLLGALSESMTILPLFPGRDMFLTLRKFLIPDALWLSQWTDKPVVHHIFGTGDVF